MRLRYFTFIRSLRSFAGRLLRPPSSPGSAHRMLTYDQATDEAIWDGAAVRRADPILP